MSLKGKIVFISHPYSDDPVGNKEKVDKICRYWVKQGVIPISPLHLFSFYDNDTDRNTIMEICYHLIDKCDLVFMYGDSLGCTMEREYAEDNDKKVVIFYNECDNT